MGQKSSGVSVPSPAGPGCPGDLDTDAAAVWRKVRALIVKRGDWTDSADAYGLIVSQLARYEMRGRKAREGLKGEDGHPTLTAVGSTGNLVAHPNVKTAMDAEKAMLECLRELRLTPREIAKGGDAAPAPTGGGKFDLE